MICVSIGKCTFDEISSTIGKFGLLEIRLDLCGLSTPEIEAVFGAHPNLIAACRHGSYSDAEEFGLLKTAICAGAAFVDIDFDMPADYKNKLRQSARKFSCKVIHSYHNFSETPGRDSLRQIYNELLEYGPDKSEPDIIKIATMINDEEDNSEKDCARLLSLYDYGSSDCPALIAIGMGNRGKITRLAAPLLGAPFTYASIDNDSGTADGQLDVDTMREIYKLLSY